MLRFVLLFTVAVVIVAIITRSPTVKRGLLVLLGVLGAYALLKVTGVIEAIAPARNGVF